MHAEMPHAGLATPLDRNFLIIGGVARSQRKCCISVSKHAIGLKFDRGLARAYQAHIKFDFPIRRIFPNLVTYNYVLVQYFSSIYYVL